MNPLFDQMRAAWESGGSAALHTAAESAAQQGAAETDIYTAVERLLLSLRESGLDDDDDDRINDVLDRLTGWCHTSCHIHTTPSAPASERTVPQSPARDPKPVN